MRDTFMSKLIETQLLKDPTKLYYRHSSFYCRVAKSNLTTNEIGMYRIEFIGKSLHTDTTKSFTLTASSRSKLADLFYLESEMREQFPEVFI